MPILINVEGRHRWLKNIEHNFINIHLNWCSLNQLPVFVNVEFFFQGLKGMSNYWSMSMARVIQFAVIFERRFPKIPETGWDYSSRYVSFFQNKYCIFWVIFDPIRSPRESAQVRRFVVFLEKFQFKVALVAERFCFQFFK